MTIRQTTMTMMIMTENALSLKKSFAKKRGCPSPKTLIRNHFSIDISHKTLHCACVNPLLITLKCFWLASKFLRCPYCNPDVKPKVQLTAEDTPKSNCWRKQTSLEIIFYIEMQVGRSNIESGGLGVISLSPNDHVHRPFKGLHCTLYIVHWHFQSGFRFCLLLRCF